MHMCERKNSVGFLGFNTVGLHADTIISEQRNCLHLQSHEVEGSM
jgi:hypothetical protein